MPSLLEGGAVHAELQHYLLEASAALFAELHTLSQTRTLQWGPSLACQLGQVALLAEGVAVHAELQHLVLALPYAQQKKAHADYRQHKDWVSLLALQPTSAHVTPRQYVCYVVPHNQGCQTRNPRGLGHLQCG